jgi:CubicO group peptidase (beta-lactamase class C family)
VIEPLTEIDRWGTDFAAAAVINPNGLIASHGTTSTGVQLASVTKLLTAYAALVAVEEGAVSLTDPVGQPGCTLEHLLCHAGGYSFDGAAILAPPGTRRMYSNSGYELLAEHISDRTGIPFADYLSEGIFVPLGMTATELRGSAGSAGWSTVDDMCRFAAELLRPSLIDSSTALLARSVHFPELGGVLPGWSRFDPLPWGLGPEIRGTKSPTWMGSSAPPSCFGHFGRYGTFLWVDPEADLATVVLTDREFGTWAQQAWPSWSDSVRATYS